MDGRSIFYREAGPERRTDHSAASRTSVVARMFEPLLTRLADQFHMSTATRPSRVILRVNMSSIRDGETLLSRYSTLYPHNTACLRLDQGFTSRMTSSSTGESRGRLATPKTSREETVSSPKTSRSNSDAASATLGCSVNSGVAATYTPRHDVAHAVQRT